MVQVSEHQDILYELETRLLSINRTHLANVNAVSHISLSVAILTDICTGVTFLTAGLISLKENVVAATLS